MIQPLVSICCICYNQEEYIGDTLDGFVMQHTNFSFEIVISDDCSSDQTRRIITEYKQQYPNLIHDISPQNNKGVFSNFLYTLQHTRGKYLAFCEGDDFWIDPYKLQKQVDFMESHPEVGLCYTDYNLCSEKQIVEEDIFHNNPSRIICTFEEQLINSAYIAPMTWLFRRELYMQIAPANSHTDGTFALSLDFFANSKVAYLPETTAVYRSHIGSATTQTDPKKHWKYEKGVFDTQVEYAEKYHCSNDVINRIKIQGYADFMFPALEADDEDFVKEALEYYRLQGMEMKWFADKCRRYIRYHQQYEMIRKSKAYKLGKMLIKPFKWLKR